VTCKYLRWSNQPCKQPISCTQQTRNPPKRTPTICPNFIYVIYLTCTYIVSFICVIVLSQGVPDGDSRRRPKHVALTYNYCDLRYQNKITRVHLLVSYFMLITENFFICILFVFVSSESNYRSESQNGWTRYSKWGFGNGMAVWTGVNRIEFNLRYTEFALSSWVKHTRPETDHTPPCKAEVENEWNCTSTHLHTGI
jgi:hypothetical protein